MLARIGTLITDWIDRNTLTEIILTGEEIHIISLAWIAMPAAYLLADDLVLSDAYLKVLEGNEYRHLIGRAECYLTYEERKALKNLIDGYCEWMADKLPNLPICFEKEYMEWYGIASGLIHKLS